MAARPSDPIPAPSGLRPGEDDELARLGERIAELAADINSAEARMMTLIAEFDRRGGWKDGPFSCCAEWLAWRIGITIGPARERVRAARALENLPRTADALREGNISYAKVRALTRVATPESEAELLEFAQAGSAAKLERTVRMWKKRNTRGTNPSRKSCKVLQGCTICVFLPLHWTLLDRAAKAGRTDLDGGTIAPRAASSAKFPKPTLAFDRVSHFVRACQLFDLWERRAR